MKAFTSLEQSKKLAEILPHESADMCWQKIYDENHLLSDYRIELLPFRLYSGLGVPAWSLTALLKLLRSPILRAYEDGMWFCSAIPDLVKAEKYERMTTNGFDEPVDDVVDLIISLKEKDLL